MSETSTEYTMKIKYESNNSGGSWWLDDGDWKALEDAGWYVEWGGLYFCHSKWPSLFGAKPAGIQECPKGQACHGHRSYSSYEEALSGKRYLGALAKSAWKEMPSEDEAIREFERLTNLDASAEGCPCCGSPHYFYERPDDREHKKETSKKRKTK